MALYETVYSYALQQQKRTESVCDINNISHVKNII